MMDMNGAEAFWSAIPRDIRRVAVIGAGAMGGGIAAQFANAGLEVVLLDMPGSDGEPANAPAQAGLARQVKVKGFMGPIGPGRIRTGNIAEDLALVADVDWIIEVVVEKLEVKQSLYARLEPLRRPDTIVSSNTSTLLHAQLVEGRSEGFRRNFLITHFFNPPRQMPLLEIVSTSETDARTLARVEAAASAVLGKTVVICRDTPGFIANRIGCFWMAAAAMIAREQRITVEEADAVHQVFGVPRTGVFGLFDLIGIDLVPQVWRSLVSLLPGEDRFQSYDIASDPLFIQLCAEGRFGRKAGAGFYRKGPDGNTEATDLTSGNWRPHEPVAPKDLPGGGRDLAALLADTGRIGMYARTVLTEVIGYAAEHAPAIAASPADIDVAMQLGYAWRSGPFELADLWGAVAVASSVEQAGRPIPALLDQAAKAGAFWRDDRFFTESAGASQPLQPLSVARLKAERGEILGNEAATLFDTGDGIGLFAIHTKMNSLHPAVLDLLDKTLPLLGNRLKALVIGNDDPRAFSAGADLRYILSMIDAGQTEELRAFIDRGQRLFFGLRYAPVPVVAAVHGFALGGGFELALHCDRIAIHAEAKPGLPEVTVGLVPAWGGCTSLVLRGLAAGLSPEEAARRSAANVFAARHCASAEEALEAGFLGSDDRLVMDRNALIDTARTMAQEMLSAGYHPPEVARLDLPAAMDLSNLGAEAGDYDRRLLKALAGVFSGSGPRSDRENMIVEREVLFQLAETPETRARMNHMLQTGKPLKN